MSIKQVVLSQYKGILNRALEQAQGEAVPNEGWLRTARKALNMSGVQLAKRLGVTKAAVFNMEKAEQDGGVTLKKMEQMAEAMGCRFVYSVVPEKPVNELLSDQARKKAVSVVSQASQQMALEAQTLSKQQMEYEIERLQLEFLKDMPKDFWDDN